MREEVTHIVLNGDEQQRYDGNLNISFACVEGESMIMAIKDLAVSSGSACTSASLVVHPAALAPARSASGFMMDMISAMHVEHAGAYFCSVHLC